MDLDYRFDKRDGQYKLLDFNPRIGAQFRLLVDDNGLDVARALYRDLTGQTVRHSGQVDGRVLVVEPYDLSASLKYFWRGELSAYAWFRSFKGRKEFAWFAWDDPLPSLMAWGRLAIRAIRKRIRIEAFRFAAARRWIGRYSKTDSADAEPLRFRVGKSNLLRRLNSSSKAAVTPDQ
jgi:predicted ATP-grasp superfamily ATP-dependent carboligase